MTQRRASRISGREPSLGGEDRSHRLTGLEPSISGEVALLSLLKGNLQGSTKWDQSACDQLQQMGKDALPSLLHLLHDTNWRIRRAAAVALGVIGDPDSVPDLLMALRDRHPAVKSAAAGSLRKSGKAAVPGLIVLLDDADGAIRLRSIELLGAIRDTSAAPALLQRLDREPYCVFHVDIVETLFAFRDREVLRSLVRIAFAKQGSLWEHVLNMLMQTKWWQSNPDLIPYLFQSLKSNNPRIIQYTAVILNHISDKRAAPVLAQALNDPNEVVRNFATNALSSIGDRRAVPGLVVRLSDESSLTRFAAVLALNALGDTRAMPALEKALDDPDSSVRIYAAAGLWTSGHQKARKVLMEYLRHPDPGQRGQAMLALAGTKDPDVITFIEAGLQDKDTKLNAIRALGEFRNSKEACSLVESAIKGETSTVILRAAIDTLAEIGRPEAIPVLQPLTFPYSAVSWYASDAINRIKKAQRTSRA